mmetsp:Transcript_43427/g.68795  ORF Transcript_43427/g.68795 Transcript_43427/m.68795 type:complete len:84 (+) Transcript_43427:1091-1342(+)
MRVGGGGNQSTFLNRSIATHSQSWLRKMVNNATDAAIVALWIRFHLETTAYQSGGAGRLMLILSAIRSGLERRALETIKIKEF